MDPRTRFILYQMLNRGQLREMNGCISTGKEVIFIFVNLISRRMCIMQSAQKLTNWQ